MGWGVEPNLSHRTCLCSPEVVPDIIMGGMGQGTLPTYIFDPLRSIHGLWASIFFKKSLMFCRFFGANLTFCVLFVSRFFRSCTICTPPADHLYDLHPPCRSYKGRMMCMGWWCRSCKWRARGGADRAAENWKLAAMGQNESFEAGRWHKGSGGCEKPLQVLKGLIRPPQGATSRGSLKKREIFKK